MFPPPPLGSMGKEKTNKHEEFWRDPPWRVSRLSRGNVPSVPSYVPSVPLNWNLHINRPKRPGCPWDVPTLSLGRFRDIPTTKFLYVIFLYRIFLLPNQDFWRSYRAIPAGPTPLGWTPPNQLPDFDLIFTPFRPNLGDFWFESGPIQVKIRSKSGPGLGGGLA